MSVCSNELLELAEDLVGGEGECRARAAVGRSYYALFHEATATAESLKLQQCPADKKLATHERLIYRYENGGSKGLAALGRTMRKQKQMRAVADYDIREDFRVEEARLHIANSMRVMKDLRRISQSEVVNQA
jgi:uncharacterized protein (UPF0332 family)